jgi:hypothetical protein
MFRRDPVPGVRRFRWHRRSGRNSGVSANSRVASHRYMDEGDKGPAFRRLIRRRETRLWRAELED